MAEPDATAEMHRRDPDIRDDVPVETADQAPGWADNRRVFVIALSALCAALLVADPFVKKKGYFEIEHWWGFYGIYALVTCAVLVLAGSLLRRLIIRQEDYYDDR